MAEEIKRPESVPIDVDKSKLTDFRQLANGTSGKNTGLVGWFTQAAGLDYSDEEPVNTEEPEEIAPEAEKLDDSSQRYWMSDKNCIVCYECQTAFNIFVRRHHCRLCGQIFCADCSKYKVPGEPFGFSVSRIRVCKHCYDSALRGLSAKHITRKPSTLPSDQAATLDAVLGYVSEVNNTNKTNSKPGFRGVNPRAQARNASMSMNSEAEGPLGRGTGRVITLIPLINRTITLITRIIRINM